MKKLRWQLLIIFLTGFVIGILLLIEQPGFNPLILQPASGGTYTEGIVGEFNRLNPLLDSNNPADRDIDRLVFSSLFTSDDRGLPQKDLVENWGMTQDGTIYNIVLKSGVKWHDGEPLTSEDVVFTIGLLKEGGSVISEDLQTFWQNVEVTALGDLGLQFKLPEPFAPFLDYLDFGILPKHLLDGASINDLVNSPFNMQPIGTGPYGFKNLIIEDGKIAGLALSANKEYYIHAPYIQNFVFRYYPDSNSALQAYQKGIVQGVSKITLDALPAALANQSLLTYSGRLPEMSMILINLDDPQAPFLQEASIRKALLLALDRQTIINQVLKGQGIIADGPIFPGTWAYYENLTRLAYSPEEARSLIIQAGYILPAEGGVIRKKEELEFAFTLLYPETDQHRQIAEMIQSYWEKLDIRVDLEALPYDQLISERLDTRNYQVALVDLNLSRTADPDPYPFWDQAQIAGGQNYSQWDNRLVSEYLENARVSTDMEERIRLYRNFQVVFIRELPALPLFYPVYTFGVDQTIQGVSIGPMFDTSDRFTTVIDWFLLTNKQISETQSP